MNKSQKQWILSVGLLLLWWWLMQKKSTTSKQQMETVKSELTIAETVGVPIKKEIIYRVTNRDPLLSPAELKRTSQSAQDATIPPFPQFTIHGMVWGVNYPLCIINGRVYSIGDEVEGAEIREIKKEGIVFSFHGRKFTARPWGPLDTSPKEMSLQ
jgi:hypothetical protein